MQLSSWPRTAWGVCVALLAASACAPTFKLSKFRTNEALYAAATREYKAGHWDNAIQAYERLYESLVGNSNYQPSAEE